MEKGKGARGEDRRGIRRKLALHGGLEYPPTPTGWLHHRHRLHLLRPTSSAYLSTPRILHLQGGVTLKTLPVLNYPVALSFSLSLSSSRSLFLPPLHPSYARDPAILSPLCILSFGGITIPRKRPRRFLKFARQRRREVRTSRTGEAASTEWSLGRSLWEAREETAEETWRKRERSQLSRGIPCESASERTTRAIYFRYDFTFRRLMNYRLVSFLKRSRQFPFSTVTDGSVRDRTNILRYLVLPILASLIRSV